MAALFKVGLCYFILSKKSMAVCVSEPMSMRRPGDPCLWLFHSEPGLVCEYSKSDAASLHDYAVTGRLPSSIFCKHHYEGSHVVSWAVFWRCLQDNKKLKPANNYEPGNRYSSHRLCFRDHTTLRQCCFKLLNYGVVGYIATDILSYNLFPHLYPHI